MEFKFRNLLKGTHLPRWLNGLDVNETKEAVTAWFDEVAAHYPDIYQIEVVDGAVRNSAGRYHSGFEGYSNVIEALGGDSGNYEFVATAFNMARKRWPHAVLIYNDYDEGRWENDPVVDLILKLQNQDAAVDALGIQAGNLMVQGLALLRSVLPEAKSKTAFNKFTTKYKFLYLLRNTILEQIVTAFKRLALRNMCPPSWNRNLLRVSLCGVTFTGKRRG